MQRVERRLLALAAAIMFVFCQTNTQALAQDAAPAPESTVQTFADGTHVINASALSSLAGIVISQGATALIDFGNLSTLDLTGNFVNNGTLYLGSSNAATTAATLGASNIINNTGASITSILPAEGIAGFVSAVTNLSITLTAIQDIINAGTISSAGNLSMVAGGSIINSGAMTAAQNLNVTSMIGNIVNSGTMAALNGNLNIASAAAQNLVVNNINGVMQALNGSINVRDALFNSKSNLDIFGGDWLSKELNLYTGSGNLNVNVGQLTGTMNISAGEAHALVSTNLLKLGNMTITGDPTFYNGNANSDIEISGSINSGEALTIATTRDIYTLGSFTISANDGTDGKDINLIAGANITAGGATSNQVSGSGTFSGGWSGDGTPSAATVTIDGPSPTGGNINFSSFAMSINTQAVDDDANGGNIRLIAYADSGTGTNKGQISFASGSTISSGGDGTGTSGNITILAPNGIDLPLVNSDGGTGGGAITIGAYQPAFNSGSTMDFATDGSISSGNDFTLGTIGTGAITLNNIVASESTVTINGGTNADINFYQNITGDNVSITANGAGNILSNHLGVATVNVGVGPVGSAVTPDGNFVYVTNETVDTVSVINTTLNLVVDTITGLSGPIGVAVNPAGTRAYVTTRNSNQVAVIDTSDNSIVTTINVGSVPYGVAVTSDGSKVYVTNRNSNNVSVIDTTSNTVVATIPVGLFTFGVTVNSAGTFAYATAYDSDNVSVINTATNSVVATVNVGDGPIGVAVNPTGTRVYVANRNSGSISVIDTATNTVVTTIAGVGTDLFGVAVNPAGTFLYASSQATDSLKIIDTSTNTVVQSVNVGDGPLNYGVQTVSFVGDDVTAYVTNNSANTVSIVKLAAIVSPHVDLLSGSGNINVGTNTLEATLTANTSGDVTITETSSIGIGASSVGGTFFVGAGGTILTTDTVTAGVVNFLSPLAGGGVSIGADLTGTNGVTLYAPQGTITQTAGLISSPGSSVTLQSTAVGNGSDAINIETSTNFSYSGPISADTVRIVTTDNNGSITLSGNVTAGTSVMLSANGSGDITTPNTVVGSPIAVQDFPFAVAVNAQGTFVYVCNTASDTVSVIDTSTQTVVATINVGSSPRGIAVSPDGTRAYVANRNDNNVSVINTTTNMEIDTIAVGNEPMGVTVGSSGRYVYVVNPNSNNLSIIDTTNDTVQNVAVGAAPQSVAVNFDETFAYVTNQSASNVSVVDLSSHTVVDTIAVGATPAGIAFNPADTFVYVVNNDSDSVSVIDATTNSVVTTISLPGGSNPVGIAVNPSGTLAYVGLGTDDAISIIDTARNTVIQTVSVGDAPIAQGNFVGFVGDNATAYIANGISDNVSVVRLPAISAPTITLSSGSGNIIVGTNTSALTLTANTDGDVNITERDAVGIGASTVGGTFMVGAAGQISTEGPIMATNVILQNASPNGTIIVGDDITGSTVTLTTVGPDTLLRQTAGTITGGTLEINAAAIGSPTDAIDLRSGNTFAFGGNILGDTVDIRTSNGGAGIVLGGDVTGDTSVHIESAAGGNVVHLNDISGTTVELTAGAGGQILSGQSITNTIGVGANPTASAISPNGQFAYIVNLNGNSVSVIDTTTDQVTDTITVGSGPTFVAFTPDSAFAYVTNADDGTVTVINTADNSTTLVDDPDSTFEFPQAIAITPDGKFAYVTNGGSNTVSVIDLTSNTVVGEGIQVGNQPQGIAISPDGQYVYVANFGSGENSVSIIRTSTNETVNTIAVGDGPRTLVANPNGQFVYVVNVGSADLSVIDVQGEFVMDTISLGGQPTGISTNPQGTLLYVTNPVNDEVTILETASFSSPDAVQMSLPQGNGNFVGVIDNHVVAYVPSFSGNSVAKVFMPTIAATTSLTLTTDSNNIEVGTNLNGAPVSVTASGVATITDVGSLALGTVFVGPHLLIGAMNSISTNVASGVSTQDLTLQTGADGSSITIGSNVTATGQIRMSTVGDSGSISVTDSSYVYSDFDQTYRTANFNLDDGASLNSSGNISITGPNNLTLSGTGQITPSTELDLFAFDAIRLGSGLNWTITQGSGYLTGAQLLGPDSALATFNFQDPSACVCMQEANFGSIRFGAQTADQPTTINFDVPFLGISADDGFEIKFDANTILQNTGLIGFDPIGNVTLRNEGTIRSTGGLDPVTIGVTSFGGSLTLAGTGTLDPGAGFGVGIFAAEPLLLENGVNQTVVGGDLFLDIVDLRGADNGTATLAVTGGGMIVIGPECGCGSDLDFRAVTDGNDTTINLNASTVAVNALDMNIHEGATLSTTGAWNITLGDGTNDGYTLTIDGILRQTGSGTLVVSTQPSDRMILRGTGTIRQDAATPSFTAFTSDQQIQLGDGLDLDIQSASTSTSSPVYFDTPVIGGEDEFATATITTDGGAFSMAPDGGASSISISGGNMTFNGGPLYVQAVNIAVEDSTVLSTNSYLGFIVTDDGDITNNGTIVATGTCAGCNGVNQFFLGFGDLDLFGTAGVFSPGTQGTAFTVNNGFTLTLNPNLNWTQTSGGLAFFQGSTIVIGDNVLFEATNNATIALSSPVGSNLTVVMNDTASAELRNNGGIMGIVPQTSGTSIFFNQLGTPGLVTLLLNTTVPAPIYVGTFAPGSTNISPLFDLNSNPNPIIYFGTVNGLTKTIEDTTAEPSLAPAIGSPDDEDDASSGKTVKGTARSKQSDESAAEGELEPVAYIHGGAAPSEGMLTEKHVAADALLTGRVRLEGQALETVRSRGVLAWQEGEAIRLDAGSLLLAPAHDVVVKTPEGDVHVAAGSAAYIMATGSMVAIYNLHDEHKHAVRVEVAGEKLAVHAGRHLVLTRNYLDGFGQVNPMVKLGYRQVKEHKVGNGLRAFQGEFSLVSALKTIGGARELLASADANHKGLSDRMMKTAAIQAYLTVRNGAFASTK